MIGTTRTMEKDIRHRVRGRYEQRVEGELSVFYMIWIVSIPHGADKVLVDYPMTIKIHEEHNAS